MMAARTPTTPPIVRPASEFSLKFLTEIYNRSRIDYIVPMPMSVRRMEEYIRTYDVDLSRSAIALAGEEPLGLAMLGVRGQHTWITRMGVIPAKRRRGIGKILLRHLIRESRQLEADYITLEVIKGNEAARRLFHRHDFREVRELLILRRPPIAPRFDAPPYTAELLYGQSVFALLEHRTTLPSWIDELPSLRNAGSMHALRVELPNGSRGWVAFQLKPHQLSRIVMEVEEGNRETVARALLHALHTRYPRHDTKLENIPADSPFRQSFEAVGYFITFRRVEMMKKLSYIR